VRTIQLRVKNKPPDVLDTLVARASAIGRQYGARLFINDYWALAIEHGAYGVHLGQEDLAAADLDAIRRAGLRLGISTHSEFEWARAVTVRPSYIALGTVFPTTTKPAILIGTENLCRWVRILQDTFPLTAIGGIKPGNLGEVLASGVRSVAVATAITEAEDYLAAIRQLARPLAANYQDQLT
jgi:thiamine-phosphate diphosphorylase